MLLETDPCKYIGNLQVKDYITDYKTEPVVKDEVP